MGDVSAIIVTRGDVDLTPIFQSLPPGWEKIVWSNAGHCWEWSNGLDNHHEVSDLSVYGRYAAIEHASHDLIYVQDDDCIVSDPQAIVAEWESWARRGAARQGPARQGAAGLGSARQGEAWEGLVANMPARFREQPFYQDGAHALVGFGCVFHRDAPERAFRRFSSTHATITTPLEDDDTGSIPKFIQRTCDIVFTALTPRVLVDVPYENLPHAYADGRMYRQQGHQSERSRMLELVRKVAT